MTSSAPRELYSDFEDMTDENALPNVTSKSSEAMILAIMNAMFAIP